MHVHARLSPGSCRLSAATRYSILLPDKPPRKVEFPAKLVGSGSQSPKHSRLQVFTGLAARVDPKGSLEKRKVGTKKKRPPILRMPSVNKQSPVPATPPRNLDSRTFITIGEKNFEVEADDLVSISELGRGAYGVVEKVHHAKSDTIMAVKRIRATVNTQEQKRLVMDLDVSMRTVDCFYTVTFYGALFREIVRALEHLHSKLSVIHRDVKPSNVLINKQGHVKMCDFGISGYLVDSVAKTLDAGCKPYMAPERINPELNQKGYNVKSDVWSLGITLVRNRGDLGDWQGRKHKDYLTKNPAERMSYLEMMDHPFFTLHDTNDPTVTEMASFVTEILGEDS
ncbi:hypothetical protein Chor_015279 [Crotalus horridus]